VKYDVWAGDEIVGWSELPHADPPMGYVFGPFHPNEDYAAIQPLIRECHKYDGSLGILNERKLKRVTVRVRALDLKVKTATGETLEPEGGVHLTDFSAELGEIQLDVFGLPHETMIMYWPTECEQYWQES
jgi:hypothetical protein